MDDENGTVRAGMGWRNNDDLFFIRSNHDINFTNLSFAVLAKVDTAGIIHAVDFKLSSSINKLTLYREHKGNVHFP